VARLTTQALVNELVRNGQRDHEKAEAVKKRRNAVEALRVAVVNHPDEETRHFCAELLREANETTAVPELIEALRDRSPHVRFDALSALSRILKTDVGWWLGVEAYQDSPGRIHRRVAEWWKRNERYVWW